MPTAHELNFDALVGPTHNYAGLAPGNIASATHAGARSSPRAAARQGLDKMRTLVALGLTQGVLPPQERPHLPTLRTLGFTGDDAAVLRRAADEAPALLGAVCSASSMWCANAATVSPSADTADTRVHFTPANLNTLFHRHLEPPVTTRALRAVFSNPRHFAVHEPLPPTPAFADEGAANFMRFCATHEAPGVEALVYGRKGIEKASADASHADAPAGGVNKFPARQTLESCEAIARRHTLNPARTIFVRQNPRAIDQGVFHNDVIAVANATVLFAHEEAFAPGEEDRLLSACRAHLGDRFAHVRVPAARVSIADAVKSYLFNSQLLTVPSRPDGRMVLVAPSECENHPRVRPWLDELVATKGPIAEVIYVDVRQSMNNGGGPACLRLRVVLTQTEHAAMNQGVLLTDALATTLERWIDTHYREHLLVADLADPKLVTECRDALDELTRILGLGAIYDFQRDG
ncbi:MAG: N-succinylarginine dihydrolase [Phycisphaerales bacterium]